MAQSVIATLTTVLLALLGGVLITRPLVPSDETAGLRIGVSFLIGSGWLSMTLLALSVMHVPWTTISLPVAFLVVPLLLIFFPAAPATGIERVRPFWYGYVIDALTATVIILAIFYSTLTPMRSWDFWAVWGLKGRVFLEHKGVDWKFLQDPDHFYAHPDYPLLLPLLLDASTVTEGKWDDQSSGLWFPALACAALLIFRRESIGAARSHWKGALAALAASAWLLSSSPGLADAPLAAFLTSALLLIRRGGSRRVELAGGILLGFAVMTKNEGLGALIAVSIALLLLRRKSIALVPGWIAALTWTALKWSNGLQNYLTSGSVGRRVLARVGTSEVWREIASAPLDRPIFWLLVVIMVIVSIGRIVRSETFLTIAVSLQLLAFVCAYFMSPLDLHWHIANSWSRLISQLAPLLIFLLVSAQRNAEFRMQNE